MRCASLWRSIPLFVNSKGYVKTGISVIIHLSEATWGGGGYKKED